jgi:hypothetical protein
LRAGGQSLRSIPNGYPSLTTTPTLLTRWSSFFDLTAMKPTPCIAQKRRGGLRCLATSYWGDSREKRTDLEASAGALPTQLTRAKNGVKEGAATDGFILPRP